MCDKYIQRLQNIYENFYYALTHCSAFGFAQKYRPMVQNAFSSEFYIIGSTVLKCPVVQMNSQVSMIVENLWRNQQVITDVHSKNNLNQRLLPAQY